MQRTVVMLGANGTMGGISKEGDDFSYEPDQLTAEQLLAKVAHRLPAGIRVEPVDLSWEDGFALWQKTACLIDLHLARRDVCGLVVPFGTNTLEETSYFVRALGKAESIAMTAAMRYPEASSSDVQRNLIDAIVVAAHPDARGTCFVMNGEVLDVHGLRKTRTGTMSPFEGFNGPFARVERNAVELLHGSEWPIDVPEGLPREALQRPPAEWPWVEVLIERFANQHAGRTVDRLVEEGVQGLVVAATGNAGLGAPMAKALMRARIDDKVRVMVASRCANGLADRDDLPSSGRLNPAQAYADLTLKLLVEQHR